MTFSSMRYSPYSVLTYSAVVVFAAPLACSSTVVILGWTDLDIEVQTAALKTGFMSVACMQASMSVAVH